VSGYELVMTRTDVFCRRQAGRHRAAPPTFISIHADPIESKETAQAIRGVTVTRSERA
jgi:N-acetylmuramoyl-L-alanine amidase